MAELTLQPQSAFTFFLFFFPPLPLGCCSSCFGCISHLRLSRAWGNSSCVRGTAAVSPLREWRDRFWTMIRDNVPDGKKKVNRQAEKNVGHFTERFSQTDAAVLVAFTLSTAWSTCCQPIKTSLITCSAICQLCRSAVMRLWYSWWFSAQGECVGVAQACETTALGACAAR